MSFSYTASIILLSLAMLGIWVILRDIWLCLVEPRIMRPPSVTLLLVVKDMEDQVEEIMYYVAAKMEQAAAAVDVVVIDCGSEDLTPRILERIAAEYACFTIIYAANTQGVSEALPICRGAVIYVFDLVKRMNSSEFFAALYALMRRV